MLRTPLDLDGHQLGTMQLARNHRRGALVQAPQRRRGGNAWDNSGARGAEPQNDEVFFQFAVHLSWFCLFSDCYPLVVGALLALCLPPSCVLFVVQGGPPDNKQKSSILLLESILET